MVPEQQCVTCKDLWSIYLEVADRHSDLVMVLLGGLSDAQARSQLTAECQQMARLRKLRRGEFGVHLAAHIAQIE